MIRPYHLYHAAARLRRNGPTRPVVERDHERATDSYRYEPIVYMRDKLGWEPWPGDGVHPGQVEVLEWYSLALAQQFERYEYLIGERTAEQCELWTPGAVIQNWGRIEAGHTVGKTKLAAGIVNHFYDSFVPCVGYTFAPSKAQVHDLLWKEIKSDRAGAVDMPGRIMDLELRRAYDHFIQGRATDNSEGRGTERIQGQHARFQIYILDEAEGIASFVWEALESLTSGGISIVILLGNPRTRTSEFYKAGQRPEVKNFRISCLYHPNVVAGRPLIPDAVSRDYVNRFLRDHCEVVPEHSPDDYTFTVHWDVPGRDGRVIEAGAIFQPDAECLFRVLGIAPANLSDDTVIPPGRYEAAVNREPVSQYPMLARIGVDVARYGRDAGTIYVRHDGKLWREARIAQQNTTVYARRIKAVCRRLFREEGVRSIHIRVDGGGGFGGGVIDNLAEDFAFVEEMQSDGGDFRVYEVHFNGTAYDQTSYLDIATEMYYDLGAALQRLAIVNPPNELQRDLTERRYRWWKLNGLDVKRLEPKEDYRQRMQKLGQGGYSPDDGDGAGLAGASDYIFEGSRQVVYEMLDDRTEGVTISAV